MSAGVILFITSAALYPSMRSAPTLKIWMTPLASVAMLEKLALLKIALWRAPVWSRASARRTSSSTSAASVMFLRVDSIGPWFQMIRTHADALLAGDQLEMTTALGDCQGQLVASRRTGGGNAPIASLRPYSGLRGGRCRRAPPRASGRAVGL